MWNLIPNNFMLIKILNQGRLSEKKKEKMSAYFHVAIHLVKK
jgi:hypothetical protein